MIAIRKFHNFRDWNIDRILFSKELLSTYPMEKLGNIIVPRKDKVRPADVPKERKIVAKIRFVDGAVFFKDRAIKNDMNRTCLNDLLVSNINFEKGAFSVNTWGDAYASTDYTSYIINLSKVLPEFLQVTLRSSTFLQYVASVKPKGMKTRARYEFIKNFSIPLPSIPEQEKLLTKYHSLLNQVQALEIRAKEEYANKLTSIQKVVSSYSKSTPTQERDESLLNIIRFTSTDRWEVEYIYKEGAIDSVVDSFKYSAMSIGKLQTESLFGLSVKASLEKKDGMIPVLRMSNVQEGEVLYGELKYLPLECAVTDKEPDKWLLRKGDFLITRTNGSKDLVGKAAVFDSDDIYTYASYLIRYRFDTNIVLPEYVNIIFMTPLVREQIAVLRRQGGGQYNLNSDEINSIQIPVPDIPTQKRIIQQYNDSLNDVKRLRAQAMDSIVTADKYISAALFK